MSKIDDAIQKLREDRLNSIKHDELTTASVSMEDLTTLLTWAIKVRKNNPYLIGDKVKLAVDPEEPSDEPTEGVVVAFGGPKAVLVDSGEWKHLYYDFDNVERIEE